MFHMYLPLCVYVKTIAVLPNGIASDKKDIHVAKAFGEVLLWPITDQGRGV